MSVYTSVSDDEMYAFLTQYDLGGFVSLQGIAQGITNSNYFLTTTTGRYVLTVFEVLKQEELPFFLQLSLHLSNNGVACPAPVIRKDGKLDSILAGKPACLVTCLKGSDTSWPTEAQCFNTGAMLAKMHLVGQDFPLKMENPRYDHWWHEACIQLLPVLSDEDAQLLRKEISFLDENLNHCLPSGIIHADLFKDNVLLDGKDVAGFIDFYYACNGNFMYDLAIAVNDWARTADNHLDMPLRDALIQGYESIRPLSDEEHAYFPIAQRAGCIRFWVSRLLDFYFPQSGEMTFIKDPNAFRDLLLNLN
ncbi:homoserine kinase [Neisseria iguanae]|uniref:Homoserine kinase n=1 Tax=Neisseria iguanae TaxID=90242 RepID=A0A2P7TYI0_9NEIS|nr:homoserine kinase [Neisseria iguanae]PSJ79784.1 homoserine kinase [Neisseria iguanae]